MECQTFAQTRDARALKSAILNLINCAFLAGTNMLQSTAGDFRARARGTNYADVICFGLEYTLWMMLTK